MMNHLFIAPDLIFWIILGVLTYVGVNRSRARRNNRRPPNPTYRSIHQPYQPPPPPNINYGPGYPINYPPTPTPGYNPNPNVGTGDPMNNWSPGSDPASVAWPEPVVPPPGRVIRANPDNSYQPDNASLPTKDIFVWGRSVAGWVYAGKLTVAKTLSESEIRHYADGKFGSELQDKLCIQADNFEQARYIFEQGRMF
jgi:hypothetical protein